MLLYVLWSSTEMRMRGGGASPALPFAAFYTVLLVSAVDGFLLRLTTWGGPMPLRWAGVLLFAAGSAARLAAMRRRSGSLLRTGRILQLAGLPVALGSLSGSAAALLIGLPGALREELPSRESPVEAVGDE